MTKFVKVSLPAILVLIYLSVPATASAPRLISFQGQLTDSVGARLTGTYSMTFKIYNVSTGGAALWTEAQSSVSVVNGVFDVELGSVAALTLSFDAQYWLGITVGTDPEMTPRRKLLSSPYALYADTAGNLADNAVAPKGLTVNDTAKFNGNVGIGTENPVDSLHVSGPFRVMINNGAGTFVIKNSGNVGIGIDAPVSKLQVAGNIVIRDTVVVGDTFFIRESGNVGIGNPNPTVPLHVVGSVDGAITSQTSGGARQLHLEKTGGRKYGFKIGGKDDFCIDDVSGTSTRLTIDTAGNIGIGIDTPLQKLHVVGTIRADTFENSTGTAIGSSSGGDLRFPDGTTGITPVFATVDTTTTYTVPSGKTLYITQVYGTGGTTLQAQIGATTYDILGGSAGWNLAMQNSNINYGVAISSLSLAQPIIIPANGIVRTNNTTTLTIHGVLVPSGVTPVLETVTSSATYTVPTGKVLYIMQIYSNSSTVLNITIGATTYSIAGVSGAGWNYTYSNALSLGNEASSLTLAQPIFVPAAGVVKSSTASAITINGYLK